MLTGMEHEEATLLRQQLMALHRRLRREVTTGPTTGADALVLGAIERSGEAASPGNLADDLLMATSNVAAALRRLEAAGLISRRKGGADARRVMVEITGDGRRVIADYRDQRDRWLSETASAALSADEQEQLRKAGELMSRLASYRRA
jgi:DNA-binding MarR family transcriptional regulator